MPDLVKLIVQLKTADLMRTVANHTNPLRHSLPTSEINLDLSMLCDVDNALCITVVRPCLTHD